MTPTQLHGNARELFSQFQQEKITVAEFKLQLIKLCINYYEQSGDWDAAQTNFLIEEYILPQFASYEQDRENNAYLLSLNSSGSLLNQFEPYED